MPCRAVGGLVWFQVTALPALQGTHDDTRLAHDKTPGHTPPSCCPRTKQLATSTQVRQHQHREALLTLVQLVRDRHMAVVARAATLVCLSGCTSGSCSGATLLLGRIRPSGCSVRREDLGLCQRQIDGQGLRTLAEHGGIARVCLAASILLLLS